MFNIDRFSAVPVYAQLVEQVRHLIAVGALAPGDALPSVRTLAAQLSINPNTLQKAYSELDSMGLSCAVPGSGRFISQDAAQRLKNAAARDLDDFKKLALSLRDMGVEHEQLQSILNSIYERREQ